MPSPKAAVRFRTRRGNVSHIGIHKLGGSLCSAKFFGMVVPPKAYPLCRNCARIADAIREVRDGD